MATVNIDGKDYEFDNLSEKAKSTLLSLQFVQTELSKINGQTAAYKTAENAYKVSLKKELEEGNQ